MSGALEIKIISILVISKNKCHIPPPPKKKKKYKWEVYIIRIYYLQIAILIKKSHKNYSHALN